MLPPFFTFSDSSVSSLYNLRAGFYTLHTFSFSDWQIPACPKHWLLQQFLSQPFPECFHCLLLECWKREGSILVSPAGDLLCLMILRTGVPYISRGQLPLVLHSFNKFDKSICGLLLMYQPLFSWNGATTSLTPTHIKRHGHYFQRA